MLEGAMQFGPSLDKRKLIGLVAGTAWNGFIELNRMAFSEVLPRNSESRAISIGLRLIKKHYPFIEWVISFADGTQCGDGTIYRASGFVLTGISQGSMWELPPDLAKINGGPVAHRMKCQDKCSLLSHELTKRCMGRTYAMEEYAHRFGGRVLPGFMLRYLYFLNSAAKERLTVPILPFSEIERRGAGMYKGQKRQASEVGDGPDQGHSGGAAPTRTLHIHSTEIQG
jgi:hypothetical protein